MIVLDRVSKKYSQGVLGSRAVLALQNVRLHIPKGDFVYIVGDSGAGKTTLLRILAGLEKPSQGQIEIDGVNLQRARGQKLSELKKRIGYIQQNLGLVEELTSFENILLSLETARDSVIESFKTRQQMTKSVDMMLHQLGLTHRSGHHVSSLSGGERQRVAIASTLIRQPDLILADEPTGALDRDATWLVMDVFQKLNLKGVTILMATHEREIVRRVRRKSCFLEQGQLKLEDSVCLF